jgi:signal transduction histidine kinase
LYLWPPSTVLSSASLLSRYTTTDEQDKRNRHIEKIKNSVKHLNDILEDFLSLGKLDEGKVSIHTGEFDLQEFVIDVVDEMKGFTKKEQSIDYAHQGEALVFSDKKLLKNILINLIGNAIKFSNEGCSIIIRSSTNGDLAVISIADQGIGISKDDLEHLFSSFFRAANAINIQGTGLGLHIVKRYVDLLNGQVKVESELNKGTTITITIPIIKEEI